MAKNVETPAEISICQAWHKGSFGDHFTTQDNRSIRVVHRGVWSNGIGPDFQDAMIEFDGRTLVTGSLEVHLAANGWFEHKHHLDPAYNDVILHLVLENDGCLTRRQDGAVVPIVILDRAHVETDDQYLPIDWSQFGGAICAEQLSKTNPNAVRSILWNLGDRRLSIKSARLEARFTAEPPSEIFYQELWDGLGYSANRVPMRTIAERLPLASLEAALATIDLADRLPLSQALLYGISGFLPFSPAQTALLGLSRAEYEQIERLWYRYGSPWHDLTLSPIAWSQSRVRPANHPLRRLTTGAALIAVSRSGILSSLLDPLRSGLDLITTLQHLSTIDGATMIGRTRAIDLIANVVLPFALALAEQTGDMELSVAAASLWEQLSAGEPNVITRRAYRQVAGTAQLGNLGSRGQQGLIHLDQTLCASRRCYECPIALRVLQYQKP